MSNEDRKCTPSWFGPPSVLASFHQMLLANLYDGVYLVDADRRIISWNHAAEALTGYAAEEVVGRLCCDNFLAHVDDNGCKLCENGCPFTAALQDGQSHESEVYLRHKQGHRVPVSARVVPIIGDQGRVLGVAQIFSDLRARIMERRTLELAKLAFRDFLTGLPNRHYTDLKVQQAAQEMEEVGRAYGILMIDLDEFKRVNDQHGHAVGDDLLRSVAQTLQRSLRSEDLVGRWGGEEFLVIVADATPSGLHEVGERCRKLIAHSEVRVGAMGLWVTASVGGTILRKGDSVDAAIARADSLMYLSKKNGGNRTSVDLPYTESAA